MNTNNSNNFSTENLIFDTEIIRKFDVSGPRYTSYPTADRFTNDFTPEQAKIALQNRDKNSPLSLYIHIPFCNTVCYYCACNKIITKNHSFSQEYLQYVFKELQLQHKLLNEQKTDIIQLHFGGGTPTFLSDEEMTLLITEIKKYFNFLPHGEYSIEVDPRKVNESTVKLLAELGFNRMSVGVQDFDEKVQVAVNRIQSEAETKLVIDAAKKYGFHSISIDLIYGLPFQSVAGFNRTLDRVLAMNPDRLSVYNYAHLPQMFMPQRRINADDLPHPEEKLAILSSAIQKLTAAGYVFIGMDHFAKPDDELAIAQREHRLHRNFQGYSTHANCDMLSVGISSISNIGGCYYQNQKLQETYYNAINSHPDELPIFRGYQLDADDLLRRQIIQQLMCHFELDFAQIEANATTNIKFREYFAEELASLQEMQQHKLLDISADKIVVLPAGRLLVRVIAMVFDKYLRNRQKAGTFSKVI